MHTIIPAPASIESKAGAFQLERDCPIEAAPEFSGEAKLLAIWLASESASLPQSASPSGAKRGVIRLVRDESMRDGEGYRLDISPEGIRISAKGPAGVFYGCVTLRQLAMEDSGSLQAMLIADEPRFSWRGSMLDTSRNFFSVAFLKKYIDLLAFHKLNRFHWHLTDDQGWRIEIDRYPELTKIGSWRGDRRIHGEVRRNGGFYSKADVREILEYCRERHIVVVPEIEMPGHAMAALAAFPGLSCTGGHFEVEDRFGIFEDVYCAGNDETFVFMKNVLEEVCDLFPGPWVHIGGDECPKTRWNACPKCREAMKREGLKNAEELQSWFVRKAGTILAARGKTMIGWDEILEGGLAEGAVVMSWRGTEGGLAASRAGHDVVMCPNTKACYFDHKPLDSPEEPGQLGVCTVFDAYSYDPVSEGMDETQASHVLGGQGNLWSEMLYFSRQVEYMAFPRLSALAEGLWTPKANRDFDDFSRRLGVHGRRLEKLDVNYYRGALR
jgi:hexosaminidase